MNARIVALVASVTICLVGLGTSGAASARGPAYRSVQSHALWWDVSYGDMYRELDMIRDVGANSVRVDVGWSSLETGGKSVETGGTQQMSAWYRDKLDAFMNAADARGLKVIAGLGLTPCWASSAPESEKQGCLGAWWDRKVIQYPPVDNDDFADISRWITNRYGTKLAALEVWNEPNLTGDGADRFWIAPDEPAAYASLLKAAYPAAKAGNSNVEVLAGAVGGADRPFLDQLYAHGIQDHYDGISIHPYNEWRHPADRWQDQWKKYTLLPGTEWVRQGQTAAGDYKPLWLTEFGWTTCQPLHTSTNGSWCVTEQQQADYLKATWPLLDGPGYDYVRAASVYNLREKGTDTGFESNFGFINGDFSEKPAYSALRQALAAYKYVPQTGADVALKRSDFIIRMGDGGALPETISTELSDHPPAIAAESASKLWLFETTGSGGLSYKTNTGSWSGWNSLAASGVTSAPASARRGTARMGVAWRGPATAHNTLFRQWNGATFGPAANLGGTTIAAPALTAQPATNRYDAFAIGSNKNVYQKAGLSCGSDTCTWGSTWNNIGGVTSFAPAAVSWGTNRLDVFIRGTDDQVYHRYWNGSAWSPSWSAQGGTMTQGAPAVSSPGSGRLNVFARGDDNALWRRQWTGSAWTAWESLGGRLDSAPSATSRAGLP